MLDKDKKIYMQLGDDRTQEHEKSLTDKGFEFAKDQLEDTVLDSATEHFLNGVELVQLGGNMVSITMPLAMLNLLSMFFKKIENEMNMEVGR